MALLYGHAGRLTAKNGGFRPGQLGPRALSVWDPAGHRWAEVRGEFGAAVGASVADIRLRLQFDN